MSIVEEALRLEAAIEGLGIFTKLRRTPLIKALKRLLGGVQILTAADASQAITSWAAFFGILAGKSRNADLHDELVDLLVGDENPFTLAAERQPWEEIPAALRTGATADLGRMESVATLDLAALGEHIAAGLEGLKLDKAAAALRAESLALGKAPAIMPESVLPRGTSWPQELPRVAAALHRRGAGVLGAYAAFIWVGGKQAPFQPVANPDPVRVDDLSRYEEQRAVVIANTRRFVDGKPANNLLLYGDRGTGKSATVKAVCNEYADRGLRLIEVRKKDLPGFSEILETLGSRRLRFVVFIDDLSFEETDDAFTGLKALLEGGAERRPDNVVVYATSNRRHLVKERFADRPTTAMAAEARASGDVRAFDSMQEQLSLADRFGVTVVFSTPSQDEFLAIAVFLADRRGLLPEGDEAARQSFKDNAVRWERWFNGRSPRTAQQYVDWLAGGDSFPWEI